MAMKEGAERQKWACIEAIKECELVEPGVKRIRLDEALGACISAKL